MVEKLYNFNVAELMLFRTLLSQYFATPREEKDTWYNKETPLKIGVALGTAITKIALVSNITEFLDLSLEQDIAKVISEEELGEDTETAALFALRVRLEYDPLLMPETAEARHIDKKQAHILYPGANIVKLVYALEKFKKIHKMGPK